MGGRERERAWVERREEKGRGGGGAAGDLLLLPQPPSQLSSPHAPRCAVQCRRPPPTAAGRRRGGLGRRREERRRKKIRAPGGRGEGAPLSPFPSSPSPLLFPSSPSPLPLSPTHTIPGGQDQGRVATVVGLVQRGALGRSERRCEERGGGGGERAREVWGQPPPVTTPALAFYPSPHPPRSRRRRGPRTHLGDVFLDPVIVPVHAVPPDVGLFGDEDAGLEVRERESGPEGMRRGTRAGGGEGALAKGESPARRGFSRGNISQRQRTMRSNGMSVGSGCVWAGGARV